jgi:hypothetical protein
LGLVHCTIFLTFWTLLPPFNELSDCIANLFRLDVSFEYNVYPVRRNISQVSSSLKQHRGLPIPSPLPKRLANPMAIPTSSASLEVRAAKQFSEGGSLENLLFYNLLIGYSDESVISSVAFINRNGISAHSECKMISYI